MTSHTPLRRLLMLGLVAVLLLAACDGSGLSGGPPSNALVLRWMHSTNLSEWAAQVTADFNDQRVTTDDGRPIYIEPVAVDAGQAVTDMTGGGELPALWTTADPQWQAVLNDEAGQEVFLPTCPSVAESPLVIAMWEPVARTLGWPGRSLGWLDIASLAADPSGWAYYSGGEYGATLRIGHAHPGLSESGVHTLLALVYAAESTPDGIDLQAVENPIVQASVGAFESAVAWFSTSTAALTDTMAERGLTYLSAVITYESEVATQQTSDPRLVAVYPFEGTFMATYPTCIRGGMDDATSQASEAFIAYLLGVPAQQAALAHGLRPVNTEVAVAAPLDEAHGVDPTQPAQVFAAADAASVFAIQDLWQTERKNVNLAMVLDISGSMEGQKIEQVRRAANEFVAQMGDGDWLTVIVFDDRPRILVPNIQIGDKNRQAVIDGINTITAGGGTALFDSVAFGARELQNASHVDTVSAMVVLTDGMNTATIEFNSPDARFTDVILSSGVSVYTIAYGDDADRETMQSIALATNGVFYSADETTIGDIYAEISAAFGGSAGIGR